MVWTYQLVVTDHSHHAEWSHSVGPWVEGWDTPFVAEYDVAMYIGVEVWYTVGLDDVSERSFSLARGVIAAIASGVVGSITVNVHIGEVAVVRSGT